jgi:sugar phosphate isomerase/epimerase
LKLAFTTLGCPDWTLSRIIECAAECGYDGIDFRGLAGEMAVYKLPEFSAGVAETKRKIADAGLAVSCFSSGVHIFSTANFEKNAAEIAAYAKLCAEFETPYIRVFGGKIGDTPRDQAVQTAAGHLRQLALTAKEYGAMLLLETHDDWMSCDHVRQVMEATDSDAVGVLWDVHHPYRMLGDQPEHSWATFGKWVKYTHVKDSRLNAAKDGGKEAKNGAGAKGGEPDFSYCLTGEGDIPLKRIVDVLRQGGYDGYYTLEWEKKWHPEIPEADIAFPQYAQFMRGLG